MSIQYQDLHKLVSDLRYIIQTGGNPLLAAGASGFWDRFMYMNAVLRSIIVFVVLVIAFYVMYLLIFRGYPRLLFDLASLSFYKRENVDKFLDNRGFMFKHFKQLFAPSWPTYNPHTAIGKVYGLTPSIQEKATKVHELMQFYYSKLKYDDRMREMFREYFLFFNRINTNRRKEVYSWIEFSLRNPGSPVPMMNSPEAVAAGKVRMTPKTIDNPTIINYTDFYETMVEYKKKRGLLTERDFKIPYDNQRRKNDEELVTEMFVKDLIAYERGQTFEYKRVKDLNTALKDLATECSILVQRVRDIPISLYLLLPTNSRVVEEFKTDFEPRKELVMNGKIYDDTTTAFTDVNEYSWFMFEVLQYIQTNSTNKYSEYQERLHTILDKQGGFKGNTFRLFQKALTGYLNLPYHQRVKAEAKLALSYPSLKSYFTRELLSYVNKHPIFTRVYLSWLVESSAMDRPKLYAHVMNAYATLMLPSYQNPTTSTKNPGDMVMNLFKNGDSFQLLVNSVNIMDLYLNDYRTQLTKLYEEHYITNEQFFMALWKPYFHELWTERIMERFKRTFSWGNIQKSYRRFRYKVWGFGFFGNPKSGLGALLYSLSDVIWKMFTSKPPKQSVPDPEPDMTGATRDVPGSFG